MGNNIRRFIWVDISNSGYYQVIKNGVITHNIIPIGNNKVKVIDYSTLTKTDFNGLIEAFNSIKQTTITTS